ncbi:MAG: glycosyltransferase [Candidatus Micrarchaeota archaeon]
MKLAFFTDSYLPNIDGVVSYIVNYKQLFEKMGHEVYIFAPGTKKQKDENKDPRVHYFSSTSFKPYPDYRIALFPFVSATNMIKEIRPDIIHSHGIATTGIAAFRSAKKINAPAIVSFHTMVSEATHYLTEKKSLQSFLESVAWRYIEWYYSNFDRVIAPSNFSKTILEKHNIKNVVLKPSGIDTNIFCHEVECEFISKKYKINGPIVLYVGRLAMEKNLSLLIDAAQKVINKIPSVKFIIGGKGPAEEYYTNLVKNSGLSENFIFPGFIPNNELPALYCAADVFAFPSAFDTQGLVVLEAMASGTPAVVPKNSAPAEYINDNENGYCFSDSQDFSEKIIFAIENKARLSRNAVITAKKYDLKICAKDMIDFYENLLKGRNK